MTFAKNQDRFSEIFDRAADSEFILLRKTEISQIPLVNKFKGDRKTALQDHEKQMIEQRNKLKEENEFQRRSNSPNFRGSEEKIHESRIMQRLIDDKMRRSYSAGKSPEKYSENQNPFSNDRHKSPDRVSPTTQRTLVTEKDNDCPSFESSFDSKNISRITKRSDLGLSTRTIEFTISKMNDDQPKNKTDSRSKASTLKG